jgi:hypothetical protein
MAMMRGASQLKEIANGRERPSREVSQKMRLNVGSWDVGAGISVHFNVGSSDAMLACSYMSVQRHNTEQAVKARTIQQCSYSAGSCDATLLNECRPKSV